MPRTSPFPPPTAGLPYLLFRTTPRDRYLAAMLHEHRALTATHITDLAFTTLRRANERLRALTTLGITDRTRPNPATHPGSSPYVYTLGPAGALLVAAQRDQTVKELRYDRPALQRQAVRPDLPHTLGCNTTLIHLATHPEPTMRLSTWWGPITCLRLWGDVIRPDAYLTTQHHGDLNASTTTAGWFYEYDTGTESITQLAGKLHGYHHFTTNLAGSHPVLIHLPTTTRENRLHQVITQMYPGTCPIPLATTTTELTTAGWRTAPGQSPNTTTRHHLADLRPLFTSQDFHLLPATTDPDVHAPDPTWNPDIHTGLTLEEEDPWSPDSPY